MIRRLQKTAQKNLLVGRNRKGLQKFLETISELDEERKNAVKDIPNVENWRLYSLMTVGKIMAEAALRREESRGSHFRSDFPEKNEAQFGTVFTSEN